MTKQTPETPSNIEIGSFKTPEELAEALEAKSKIDLAKRIRIISWQVQDTSTDLRQRLQDELTPQEHWEIRETLQNSWVATVFTKGLSWEEKAIQVAQKEMAWIIWEENTQSLQKVEWIWNRLSTWFDKIWDIFSEKWMVAWIWAIILMFKWIFSWDFTQLDALLDPKKSEKKADNKKDWKTLDTNNKAPDNIAYLTSLKIVLWFSPERTDETFTILNLPQIKTKTFSQLETVNSKWISEKLGIDASGKNKTEYDKSVFDSIHLLQWKMDIIEDILWKKHPNWKNELTVEQILTKIYSYTKIYNSFESYSLTDFKEGKINFWSFSINTSGSSDLTEKYDELKNDREGKLHGVSSELIAQIVWDTNSKITNENFKTTLLNSYSSPKDKEFIEQFSVFGKWMLETIKNDFFLWDTKFEWKFKEYFDKRNLSAKEVFELYLITWWKHKASEFSWAEKWIMYLKVWSFLGTSDGYKLRWETYDRSLLEAAKWESSDLAQKIPRPVIDTIKSMTRYTIETTIGALWNTMKEVFGLLTMEQKIAFWLASWVVLVLLWRLGPLRNIFNGIAIWWLWVWILWIVKQAYANNPKKFEEAFPNQTPEKLAKAIEKEVDEKTK